MKAILSRAYIQPAVQQYGLTPHRDSVLRAWSDRGDVCAVVSVFQYSGTPPPYTVELEFYSPFIDQHYGDLHRRLMSLEGWAAHFRRALSNQEKGRAYPWSMLGFALLGAPTTAAEELRIVINQHSAEPLKDAKGRRTNNRADNHLDLQRKMFEARFGMPV